MVRKLGRFGYDLAESYPCFEISAGSSMNQPSRIRLEGDRIDSDTRYDIYINSESENLGTESKNLR